MLEIGWYKHKTITASNPITIDKIDLNQDYPYYIASAQYDEYAFRNWEYVGLTRPTN